VKIGSERDGGRGEEGPSTCEKRKRALHRVLFRIKRKREKKRALRAILHP